MASETIWIFVCGLALACAVLFLSAGMLLILRRVKALETALRGVKSVLDDLPRIQNEVRDIRETLEELPLDELKEQAAFEKSFAERLEEIANYDIEVAMGGSDGT